MPRESRTARVTRGIAILEVLRRTYPEARCELAHTSPLELLVATILSAQCSDRQVNRVTADLFQTYRTAADYANAPHVELEQAIHRLGLFRSKARSIQACCRKLVEQHRGKVPDSMEELISLDGVGRKTANVVLGNAFGRNEGIVVDTHVARLSRRLGLSTAPTPAAIEAELMQWVPREDWTRCSHWLIGHGRRRCQARRPDCAGCELRALCPAAA